MSSPQHSSPGSSANYSNSVIQQYIRAAKERVEREKAEAASRPHAQDYVTPRAPVPAVLPAQQEFRSPPQEFGFASPSRHTVRPQWQARSASHGSLPVSTTGSGWMASDYENYTTEQGTSQYPPPRHHSPSSPPTPYRPMHHRRASSNSYPHGRSIQTIPEDRESRALSSAYAASSQARSSNAAATSQDLEHDSFHDDETNMLEASRGLVREASVGRKHRPTLTQIGTSESWSRRSSRQSVPPNNPSHFSISAATYSDERPPLPSITLYTPRVQSPASLAETAYTTGTGYISPSTSTFTDEASKHDTPLSYRHLRPSPGLQPTLTQPEDQRQSSRPLTTDSANSSGSFRFNKETASKPRLSERVGAKKPEPLKLELVKEAEVRGSLTSLPDLIKRALRLASNLEVGRTASRLGTDWMFEGEGEKKSANGRRRGSLGSMINSFPSTPRGEGSNQKTAGAYSIMPKSAGLHSALRRSFLPEKAVDGDGDEKNEFRRRCCGMPMWCFLVILLSIILLICAAVLVPICLIVIPNAHHNVDCVSTTVGGKTVNIGSSIPDLLKNANSSFGVPLDGEAVYQLFANAKMSCTDENTLVSLNSGSKMKRSLVDRHLHVTTREDLSSNSPTSAAQTLHRHNYHPHINNMIALSPRQLPATTATPSTIVTAVVNAATSNGIIFAMSTTSSIPTPTPSSSSTNPTNSATSPSSTTPIPTPYSTSTTSPALPNAPFTPNITSLTFSRISILYILQQTQSLSSAQTARNNLADFLANPAVQGGQEGARSVGVGGGWVVDLVGGTVTGSDGRVVGGVGSGA